MKDVKIETRISTQNSVYTVYEMYDGSFILHPDNKPNPNMPALHGKILIDKPRGLHSKVWPVQVDDCLTVQFKDDEFNFRSSRIKKITQTFHPRSSVEEQKVSNLPVGSSTLPEGSITDDGHKLNQMSLTAKINQMSLTAKPGDRVVYLDENGYDHQREYARNYLVKGGVYTVERVQIGNWSSDVFLKEVKESRPNHNQNVRPSFNTAMFGEYPVNDDF